MCTHAPAPINFRYVQSTSALTGRFVAHVLEGPDEVHRCRSSFGKDSVGGIEVLATRGRERVPVCRGHADGRRPAHGERPNCLRDLGRRFATELALLVRKPALVEQDDRVGFQTNDALRC